jgi:hypothetical protein
MRLPDHDIVRIVKRSFVYEQHHYEISIWQEPSKHRGLVLLETYCDEGMEETPSPSPSTICSLL